MQRQGDIRPREPGEQAVGQHGAGAGVELLGRLCHQHQRAPPLALHRGQHPGHAHPDRHVHVVPTAVRDEGGAASPLGLHFACIGQAGLFLHGQGVHVRAHHDRRPLAVAQQAHHTGLADLLGDVETQRP
ncbi:hypothetical protein D3C72_1298470 [compost metagenome]